MKHVIARAQKAKKGGVGVVMRMYTYVGKGIAVWQEMYSRRDFGRHEVGGQ